MTTPTTAQPALVTQADIDTLTEVHAAATLVWNTCPDSEADAAHAAVVAAYEAMQEAIRTYNAQNASPATVNHTIRYDAATRDFVTPVGAHHPAYWAAYAAHNEVVYTTLAERSAHSPADPATLTPEEAEAVLDATTAAIRCEVAGCAETGTIICGGCCGCVCFPHTGYGPTTSCALCDPAKAPALTADEVRDVEALAASLMPACADCFGCGWDVGTETVRPCPSGCAPGITEAEAQAQLTEALAIIAMVEDDAVNLAVNAEYVEALAAHVAREVDQVYDAQCDGCGQIGDCVCGLVSPETCAGLLAVALETPPAVVVGEVVAVGDTAWVVSESRQRPAPLPTCEECDRPSISHTLRWCGGQCTLYGSAAPVADPVRLPCDVCGNVTDRLLVGSCCGVRYGPCPSYAAELPSVDSCRETGCIAPATLMCSECNKQRCAECYRRQGDRCACGAPTWELSANELLPFEMAPEDYAHDQAVLRDLERMAGVDDEAIVRRLAA